MPDITYIDSNSLGTVFKLSLVERSVYCNCSSVGRQKYVQFNNSWFRIHSRTPALQQSGNSNPQCEQLKDKT